MSSFKKTSLYMAFMKQLSTFQCYDEEVIEEMTEDREMLTNPDLVEARKDLKTKRGENPLIAQKMMTYDPSKSSIVAAITAEENRTRTA